MVFFFASALTAEASTHESFSASSYYEADDKSLVSSKDATTGPTEAVEDPNNRFPNGYPGQAHHYNSVTGKYDEDLQKTSAQPTTLPAEKTATTQSTAAIPKRYEAGYNNGQGLFQQQQQHINGKLPDNRPDEFTFDPTEGRYKSGYYPKSAYAGAAHKTTANTHGAPKLAAQTNTLPGDFAHRYVLGYYPSSTHTQHGPMHKKPGSYSSYMGQFITEPDPASGTPFVASGAGCRSAYWVENVEMWPQFFTVKSTVGDAFGAPATATFGQTTLLQALLKYGSDPYDELVRSGCTSLLNSYNRGAFRLSHMKVIEQFNAALGSPEAARSQALAFETENVESIAAGSACT